MESANRYYAGVIQDAARLLPTGRFTCVFTSPPYNVGKDYGAGFCDKLPFDRYLDGLEADFRAILPSMARESILFVNLGNNLREPFKAHAVAERLSGFMTLLQTILWVKSISVPVMNREIAVRDGEGARSARIAQETLSLGHFTPTRHDTSFPQTFEYLFAFSPNSRQTFDRLAIGVEYADKSNATRWTAAGGRDLRARGDVWFVPYETVGATKKKGHPCPFPVELVRMGLACAPRGPVLDPYAGYATTAKAAHDLNRPVTCIERNPEFLRDGRLLYGLENDGDIEYV